MSQLKTFRHECVERRAVVYVDESDFAWVVSYSLSYGNFRDALRIMRSTMA